MGQYFKTELDFGGYWIKGVKFVPGHGGEPLLHCSVWKDGKRVGYYQDGDWGGEAILRDMKPKAEKELREFAKEFEGEKAWSESFCTFIGSIQKEVETLKYFKRHCQKKVIIVTPDCQAGQYREWKVKFSGNEAQIKKVLDKNHPEGYTIINELV